MSFVFDVLSTAWADLRQYVPAQDDELATRFELLLSELHDANHRLKDAVNHDLACRRLADALDKCMKQRRAGR